MRNERLVPFALGAGFEPTARWTRTHDAVIPSFDVPDRAAALAALQASGCRLIPIGPHAPDGFYVEDPFGVVFDVVERSAQ